MRSASTSEKEKKTDAHYTHHIYHCRGIESEWLRARANGASSHGFVQNENHAVGGEGMRSRRTWC
eukprot:COSAG06_NODE_2098_length_7601_cov_14.624234_2_plen_65_part_00